MNSEIVLQPIKYSRIRHLPSRPCYPLYRFPVAHRYRWSLLAWPTPASTGSRSHLLLPSRDAVQDVGVPWSTWMCRNGCTYTPVAHRYRQSLRASCPPATLEPPCTSPLPQATLDRMSECRGAHGCAGTAVLTSLSLIATGSRSGCPALPRHLYLPVHRPCLRRRWTGCPSAVGHMDVPERPYLHPCKQKNPARGSNQNW
jgi:hypothetical protein